MNLKVNIGKLELKNPILVASGTYGYGDEFIDIYPLEELGGIITKGLTLKPRSGNPPPRLYETPSGLINSIGLENIGLEKFLDEHLPKLKERNITVIVNANAESIDEFEELVIRLNKTPVDAIEINVSCPNVKKGGMIFGTNPPLLKRLIKRLKKKTIKPLIVKLTPNDVNVLEEARAAIEGGADALSLVNTYLATEIDIERQKFVLGTKFGGLSGPSIRPMALYQVYRIAKISPIPVIGVGGISSGEDVIKFLLIGATAVQIGTWNFLEPDAPFKALNFLKNYLERRGIKNIHNLIGAIN